MSAPAKCPKCGKTVYATEKIQGAGKDWHKACFKCHGDGCSITLTLATVQAKDGKIYCKAHVPKHQAKQVADTVAMKTALSAPKKVSESTGNVQKGDQIKLKATNATAPKAQTGTNQAAPAKPAAAAAEAPAAEAPAAEPAAPAAEPAAPAAEAPAAEAPAAEAPAAEAPAAEAPPAEAPAAEAPAAEAPPAEAPAAEAPPAEAPAAEAPPAEAPADAPPADG